MVKYMNLYTFLININPRFVFGEYTNEMIEDKRILVNGNKAEDINMEIKSKDVITIDGIDYTI